jgi:hypothetical protein
MLTSPPENVRLAAHALRLHALIFRELRGFPNVANRLSELAIAIEVAAGGPILPAEAESLAIGALQGTIDVLAACPPDPRDVEHVELLRELLTEVFPHRKEAQPPEGGLEALVRRARRDRKP